MCFRACMLGKFSHFATTRAYVHLPGMFVSVRVCSTWLERIFQSNFISLHGLTYNLENPQHTKKTRKTMFFSMYARGSLVILLLVTYILTDEPSNQKRVSSMYVQESLFILLLGTYIHTDQPKMSAPTLSTSVSMYVKTRSTYMYVVSIVKTCFSVCMLGKVQPFCYL